MPGMLNILPLLPRLSGQVNYSAVRGRMTPSAGIIVSKGRLTTDSIGNFALTLTNLVIGSRIHVEVESTGSTVSDIVADAATEVLTLPAYPAGSPSNNLKVKVRKASATPFYRPYDTQVTAIVGSTSIYVSQQSDE